MTELRCIYEQKKPVLDRAKDRLMSLLTKVVSTIEDKKLVRAHVLRVRVKELSSLQRKVQENEWKPDEALSRCGDLIGGRVVCNNIEDVYRFAELLKERLPSHWGNFEVQDYIKNPNMGGYRALHINFRLDVGEKPFLPNLVSYEVQIRSRLQDAWAELSHDDIYKQPDLPEDLRTRAKDLAEVLAAADKIASDIRLRVGQETVPPEHRPDLARVSQEGLAFIFKEVFGRAPPDYVVRQALDLCRELAIVSLEQLPGVLGRGEFRNNVTEAYRSIMKVPIGIEDLFLTSLYALARGDSRAIAQVRRNAGREWREIEQYAKQEMLASLPPTIEELIERLEDPRANVEDNIERWADALGATSECGICSTTIIQPFSFAEAAVQHYQLSESEVDDAHDRIESALRACGVETGGWGDGSLCAYHNEQAAKDD